MIKIVILGTSPAFNQAFFTSLAPKLQSSSSIRFCDRIVEFELICGWCGASEGVERIREAVWALQALPADGIIFAHSHNTLNPFYYQRLMQSFGNKPAILITDDAAAAFFSESLLFERVIQVNPESGENCQLALLSIIYLINKKYTR